MTNSSSLMHFTVVIKGLENKIKDLAKGARERTKDWSKTLQVQGLSFILVWTAPLVPSGSPGGPQHYWARALNIRSSCQLSIPGRITLNCPEHCLEGSLLYKKSCQRDQKGSLGACFACNWSHFDSQQCIWSSKQRISSCLWVPLSVSPLPEKISLPL